MKVNMFLFLLGKQALYSSII